MPAIRLSSLLVALMLGGCASAHNPKDPLEPFNRGMYQFNDALDKAIIKPVAKGYDTVMPPPGKMLVSNFFSNLNDVTVTINDLLQFKVVQAASDGGRVVVNSTVGLLGFVDVASAVGLEKHNEDFGQTLGLWGIGSGPYLVLPLFGPSSIRDSVGFYADSRAEVLHRVRRVDTRNQLHATNLLNKRARLLEQEKVLDEAVIDRYAYIRDAYLQRRRNLIYDGNPPREKFDDEDDNRAPDKASSNDDNESAPPVAAGMVPAVAPSVATGSASLPEQQSGVRRIWLVQRGGTR